MLTPEDWAYIDEIPGWMAEVECRWLHDFASTFSSWTEVGVHCGRSALATGLGLAPEGWLQLVDSHFQNAFWSAQRYLRNKRPDLRIVVAECNSLVAARHLPFTDVVFLDGSHEKDAVLRDIDAYSQKCHVLCGHDYDPNGPHHGVIEAVDERLGEVEHPVGAVWLRRR